ncbi:uncharacterized protein LOC115454592 isoform X2 [Manduca sexta]|uniref:uncharacterized protein LOC115454592 isoform X2 n=1 Tax=Manduca sexta TaxID=7130 RepID=UPI001182D96D|nr:uncharacterized protein LOC115454592 isoform X2 [Manduca sexta]
MAEEVLSPKLQEYINSIIKREGYLTHKLTAKTLPADGSGFMGVLNTIDIQGKTAVGDKETHIFIKNLIPNPEEMKIYSARDVFSRESFVYTELSKKITELQNEANIPEKERYKMIKSFEECNPEAIILENITYKGFKQCSRMDVVSLEFAELAISLLAKFHALSYVLKENDPNFFEEKIRSLKQPFFFGEAWDGFTTNIFRSTVALLDKDVRDKYEDKLLQMIKKFPDYINNATTFGTLCYSDYRHGNIMVKDTDNTLEIMPLDYQHIHYGCPVHDLIYFIFIGTDQDFRKKHLSHLKNLYYDTMEHFLRYFSININSIWTKQDFENVFAEKLAFGLIINFCFTPVIFAAVDDIPSVTNSLSELSFKTDARFAPRIRGTVEDFINWGYL